MNKTRIQETNRLLCLNININIPEDTCIIDVIALISPQTFFALSYVLIWILHVEYFTPGVSSQQETEAIQL